jgi:hypothetical protein
METSMSDMEMRIRRRLSGRIEPGDRVAYARGFLRSIFDFTNHDRGIVVSLAGNGDRANRIATVRWEPDNLESNVLVSNLVRESDLRHEYT